MFKKIVCGALVVVSVFGIATLSFTSAAFEYLSVSRQSEHCVASFQGNNGLVVVFCGGSGQRALYGAELVKKGYGKELVLCGTIPELSFVSGLIEEHYPDTEISGKILKVVVPGTKETVKYVVSYKFRI